LTLYRATGGLPREIVHLHHYLKNNSQSNIITQNDIEKWVKTRVRVIDNEVKKWVKKNKEELDTWKPFLQDLIQLYIEQKKFVEDPPPGKFICSTLND
jgi:hypothetical protein